MDLMSCEKCGTVFDKSRLKKPAIHDRMGKLIQDAQAVWDDSKGDFIPLMSCPVCNTFIRFDNGNCK